MRNNHLFTTALASLTLAIPGQALAHPVANGTHNHFEGFFSLTHALDHILTFARTNSTLILSAVAFSVVATVAIRLVTRKKIKTGA